MHKFLVLLTFLATSAVAPPALQADEITERHLAIQMGNRPSQVAALGINNHVQIIVGLQGEILDDKGLVLTRTQRPMGAASGTVFYHNDQIYILTCKHCTSIPPDILAKKPENLKLSLIYRVRRHHRWRPYGEDVRSYKGKLVYQSETLDIAILQLPIPKSMSFAAAKELIGAVGVTINANRYGIVAGQQVVHVGTWLGYLHNAVSVGHIAMPEHMADMNNRQKPARMIMATTMAFQGSSGGSLYNMQGELIGVLVRLYNQRLSASVPMWQIVADLDANSDIRLK